MEPDAELVPGEFLASWLYELQSVQAFELVGWNTAPETGLPWARLIQFGDGAIGNLDTILLIAENNLVEVYGMPGTLELVVEQWLAAV